MSGASPQIEVPKGRSGKMLIDLWTSPRGQPLVSVSQLFLDTSSGKYVRKKGGFALTPDEARELAAALVEVARVVEGSAPE